MKIDRVWAMPNKHTFDIKPIRELIEEEMPKLGFSVDPFANKQKLASITNDLDPQYDTDYHLDALEFLKMFETESIDCVLFDPPYTPRQLSECYKRLGRSVTFQDTEASYWGNLKKEMSRIVKPGGKVISFGWNSGGVGKTNGFKITRIRLIPHGGVHNDTICVVEEKIQCRL